jgi:hypothetical protein
MKDIPKLRALWLDQNLPIDSEIIHVSTIEGAINNDNLMCVDSDWLNDQKMLLFHRAHRNYWNHRMRSCRWCRQ